MILVILSAGGDSLFCFDEVMLLFSEEDQLPVLHPPSDFLLSVFYQLPSLCKLHTANIVFLVIIIINNNNNNNNLTCSFLPAKLNMSLQRCLKSCSQIANSLYRSTLKIISHCESWSNGL